ncbi:hypothetical protein [Deferribacter desulfuricans]|uniref:hypothetical protein n=1 Tax=Deferribacter desulfuricans TaxID=197162 RepID=UPI00129BA2EB|nr:hypothetical protein [Deferribacter desulfuricans]
MKNKTTTINNNNNITNSFIVNIKNVKINDQELQAIISLALYIQNYELVNQLQNQKNKLKLFLMDLVITNDYLKHHLLHYHLKEVRNYLFKIFQEKYGNNITSLCITKCIVTKNI